MWYVQNGGMAEGGMEWQDRGMVEQRNGEWRNGRMAERRNGGRTTY